MASLVMEGRKWEINTREDYDKAMETLDSNEMCADMSDDFSCWQREKEEVAWQRFMVRRQAIEKGIIGEHEDENRHWNTRKENA